MQKDENLKIATTEKAANYVINVLQNNTTDCDVVEACCAALISLSLKGVIVAMCLAIYVLIPLAT